MHLNMEPAHNTTGRYTTELFTEAAELIIQHHCPEVPLFLYLAHLAVHTANRENPLQAPPETEHKFANIHDRKRRLYAGELRLAICPI